jgi:hypothetical protein
MNDLRNLKWRKIVGNIILFAEKIIELFEQRRIGNDLIVALTAEGDRRKVDILDRASSCLDGCQDLIRLPVSEHLNGPEYSNAEHKQKSKNPKCFSQQSLLGINNVPKSLNC